jgi:hypothetical protein
MKKLPEGRGGVGEEAFGPGQAARVLDTSLISESAPQLAHLLRPL